MRTCPDDAVLINFGARLRIAKFAESSINGIASAEYKIIFCRFVDYQYLYGNL